LVGALVAPALATDYRLDLDHTQASFSIVHLGFSHVQGTIPVIGGSVSAGPSGIPSAVSATLNAAALDTKSSDRDNDIRGPQWFDTAKYPTMTFVSTRVEGTNPAAFTIVGNLTLHGVTKPVTLAASYGGKLVDGRGTTHLGYSATTTIDRRDYGMNFLKTVPGGALIAGNDVTISISVEAVAR
ncbi:MAG: YceI family protein, partial [Candidatus Eremiobacteraeota bacterium]|nr:YceI family protein [Candidatus Eremiobacteraeota bacterium]